MPITGSYHHVHLISRDPESTANWYVRALGGEITGTAERRGAVNVSMRLGEASLSIRGIRETDIIGETGEGNPLCIHHIGFIVEDIDGMLSQIEEHGGKLAEPVFTGGTGNRVAFVLGPDNVTLELI